MRIDPAETLRRVRRWDAARRWALRRIASAPFASSRPELSDGMTILGAIKLQATPRSVADVRSYLTELLADGPTDMPTVVLLASELATNSLRHTTAGTDGTIALAVLAVGDAIRVEVADGGAPTTPCLRAQDDEYADGGRGLHLVDLLAARWGFTRDRNGTTTWFEVTTSCDDTTCPDRTLN
ncbi:ATP-binding protein [Thermopolyspora sp. NPDC052614]|uniref:ATP-binding protein n=1 Tax=Thermopolyspora sp. NPDC052614 TaxID=3155682 RepID=UPI003425C12C